MNITDKLDELLKKIEEDEITATKLRYELDEVEGNVIAKYRELRSVLIQVNNG